MTSPQKKSVEPQAIPNDLKPEQALGLVGLGLMQKMSHGGTSKLRLVEENDDSFDLHSLRQRLEITSLAIETGAPLTTSEVAHLLGARPGSGKIERGGLIARRISRNVWRLSKSDQDSNYWRN